MKKLILLSSLLLLSSLSYSQNWEPFPEDSLFFERTTQPDPTCVYNCQSTYLMPLVKSGDINDLFTKTNNEIEWYLINPVGSFGTANVPFRNWLGKVEQDGDKLLMTTGSNDIISIDISKTLHFSDTIDLNPILFHNTTNLKLITTIDSVWQDGSDSLKSFSFSFIDSSNTIMPSSSINQNSTSTYPKDYLFLSDHTLIWSKTEGLIQTPSFNFFPYCEEFRKLDKIENVLDNSKPYSYDVFWNNIGDEIHTLENMSEHGGNTYDKLFVKKVITAISYDSINQIIYKTYDKWLRHDTAHNNWTTSQSNAGTKTVSSAMDLVDTIALNSFEDLNKAIPSGYSIDEIARNGYLFDNTKKRFIRQESPGFGISDSLEFQIVVDAQEITYFYGQNIGGEYYNGSGLTQYQESYLPVYSNINGITNGTPFTDSFILSVQETELPTPFYIQNETLFIAGNENQSYKAVRLYSISGQFIKVIHPDNLESGVDISDLTKGLYVMVYKTNLATKRFKFVKE